MSVLGAVVSVAFNIVGSADLYGDWGLNAPAYFAYDDIAVRFDKNDQTALFNSHTASFPNSRKVLHNGQLAYLPQWQDLQHHGAILSLLKGAIGIKHQYL